jgi:WD40 repeat protein
MSTQRKMEPGKLSALFKGELDWIVMKALEKDRTRRYETASAMAEDVRRFLNDELVQARPPSAWYRFRKMARRNKAAMTTTGLVAATLLLGLVVSVWQAVRATDAEQLANWERDRAVLAEVQTNKARHAEQDRTEELRNTLTKVEAAEEKERTRAVELADALKDLKAANLLEKELRQKAQEIEYEAKMALCALNVGRAQRQLDADNLLAFYKYLEKCPPDFRGWEHDYLYTLANLSQKTLREHNGPVMAVAYSPDGKRLISAGAGGKGNNNQPGELKMWDPITGRLLRDFDVQTGLIMCVAFSPDGKRLATASYRLAKGKYEVTLWDTASGKSIWAEPAGPVSVAFSPDGKCLATSSGEKYEIILRDAASGKLLRVLEGHTGPVVSLAFSPDGRRLVSASYDQTVKLWELASGQCYKTLEGHTRTVTSVAFSPDGKILASGSGALAKKGKGATGGKFDSTPTPVAHELKLWDSMSGRCLHTMLGHTGPVNSVAFSHDSKFLASASGGADNTVRLWDASSGTEIQTLKGHQAASTNSPFHNGVNSVAFSLDGKFLASASSDKTVKLWDLGGRQKALTFTAPPPQKGFPTARITFAFSPGGKFLASASRDKVRLWDVANGELIRTIEGPTEEGTQVAFSSDFKFFATGASRGKTVHLRDTARGDVIRSFERNTDLITSLAISPNGKLLASGSSSLQQAGELKLWDVGSGQVVPLRNAHADEFTCVAFSPDSKCLAGGLFGGTLSLWDTETGQDLRTFKVQKDITSVSFSPDGKWLATASYDKTVILWDADTGKQLLSLSEHMSSVHSVAFSPDGKRLASASKDGTVKLWDTVNGQELLTLRHETGFHRVVFSPDGKRLAGAADDGTIIIWDATKSMKELEGR